MENEITNQPLNWIVIIKWSSKGDTYQRLAGSFPTEQEALTYGKTIDHWWAADSEIIVRKTQRQDQSI